MKKKGRTDNMKKKINYTQGAAEALLAGMNAKTAEPAPTLCKEDSIRQEVSGPGRKPKQPGDPTQPYNTGRDERKVKHINAVLTPTSYAKLLKGVSDSGCKSMNEYIELLIEEGLRKDR